MTENDDLEPFVKLYQDMFGTIFKLQLVAEATTIPSRLAKLEFACEGLIVKIKDAHFCASGEYRDEKELVCERCMEYAENTLRYIKAKILLFERTKDLEPAPQKTIPHLKDIFKSEADYKQAIGCLYNAESPVLGPTGHFVLGERQRKQAISAWFRALRLKGKIETSGKNRELIAAIFNNFFENLNISGKTIEGKTGAMHETYFQDFITMMR